MPTGDVFKVSLFMHQAQRQFINTHLFEVGAVTTADPFDEATALADVFDLDFTSLYQDALSDDVSLGCIKIEQVKGDGLPTFIKFLSNIKGLAVGPALPDNMVAILRRRGVVMGKMHRSLLSLSGVRVADTLGSFLTSAYLQGDLLALISQYNEQLVASGGFDNAEFDPVIPSTPRVYGNDLDVTIDLTANTMSIIGGQTWSGLGFITGGQFRILAPNKNKGTYTATVVADNPTITLTNNQLETSGGAELSVQQVTGPTTYIDLTSAVPQIAIRQLNRRRSSHTGIVA